jgi:hypothetical protein
MQAESLTIAETIAYRRARQKRQQSGSQTAARSLLRSQQRAQAACWRDGGGNTSRIAGQFQEDPQKCTRRGVMPMQREGR